MTQIRRMKVSFIGPDGVGKTSLILRFTKNTFSNSYLPTIGCDFYEISYTKVNQLLQVYVWDIASQKSFERMRQQYLSYTHLTVICADPNRCAPESIDQWMKDATDFSGKDSKKIIVLNKSDLFENSADIQKRIDVLDNHFQVPVLAASAKTGENVNQVFELIGKLLEQVD